MSREYTLSSQTSVHLKQNTFSKSYSYLIVAVVCTAATAAYFVFREPPDSLGDPSEAVVVTKIPKTYTKLETVDPDERDVFQGFRTSFLPPDDIILPRKDSKIKRDVYHRNVRNSQIPSRKKRMSLHHVLPYTQDYESPDTPTENQEENSEKNSYEENESKLDESDESNNQYKESELNRIVHPEPHVDRGPFDDVVEQVRGQPELEEGEMGTIAHIYKPARSYTGIHAFWKGQGDRDTIRRTQANIMKQYMDQEADPCHDFYQYACGNWASLNPIPADKAGYDTFEMLRENLDTVLKELLEFKENDHLNSVYPGPNLDIENKILAGVLGNPTTIHVPNKIVIQNIKIVQDITKEIFNNSAMNAHRYDVDMNINEKPLYINRIKRNLMDRFKGKNKNKYYLKKRPGNKDLKYKIKRSGFISKPDQRRTRKYVKPKRMTRDIFEHIVKEEQNNNVEEDPANGDATLKARFLFKSCMNYDILHKRGHQPLLDLLDILGGWPMLKPGWNDSNFEWLELMAKLRLYNNDILLSEWVGPDIKNSEEFVIQFDQTSLGLPTRDYFLQDNNKLYLDAYKTYLIKIALLLGGEHNHVLSSATDLIAFETRLAQITSAPEDRRNVSELYQRMSLEKLETLVPEVNWRRYLCIVMNRSVQSDEIVVLFALTYVRHLVQLIETTDSNTLANYLLWRFVRHRVNNLDDRFQSAKQQFYYILFGREQAPSRWKNCISQVNSNMGMALGSMFVQKYFDETSKNDTLTMTREIQQSFRELLHLTDWIDEETKNLAAHKVDEMMLRIGYPDFILNKQELDDRYKEVKIHPDKYFENILNILQHLTKMEQSRLGQPVNKTLWNTAPAVVNAYYSRNKNQIMFPAGILQPPFYHRHFPRSLNYGGIGVVIGHEITHGFDDKGRLFDCDGNLHRWWSDTAIESFHKRAQCLIDQYGTYEVPEVHMKLDGVNTQGENIADNGGVKQAFRAYLHWLSKHGDEDETLPDLNHSHKQLFFLNFAQVWCGAMRPEAMRNKLKTAVHSPGRFRVIGTLSNSEDFARVFQCPPGSPMNPTNKCTVW